MGKKSGNKNKIYGHLEAWRNVIEPHLDVTRGNYQQAQFAADLAQVVSGKGEGGTEYSDPVEFFARTYLTGGLKNLLSETLKRLTSGNGAPIIQLQTSFGGGKTHSLLALYHLFGGKIRPEQSSAVREVLNAAGVEFLPKVNVAAIVGTWENPLKTTFWGEIAARLSAAAGKPELYEMVKENDVQKISPGVELLKQIFDAASPCLILIDEIVAYGRKLGDKELDGGTSGNFISFIQELTEAAKASKNCAVVVSIPESETETVDENGKKILAQVKKVFGRMEFVWSPVTVTEGYEIVRRRLFKTCNDEAARKNTCNAFFNMYSNEKDDFPNESHQSSYKEKLLSCYPIHPKLFDYLYNAWTQLDGFQKTRGVLRLMANVIYYLWRENSQSALIMPGDIPLNFAPVRDEMTKYLKGNWDSIINSEIDGEKSKAGEIDGSKPRFGQLLAARKTARAIFMGTAPLDKAGGIRGIEKNEIHLSTIQPEDSKNISTYNDALSALESNLYYLYSRNERLWFGVTPTLRKLVEDKREKFSEDEIFSEIEKWLRNWRGRQYFNAVHICPKNSNDVSDEQTARLVILPPEYFVEGQEDKSAFTFTKNILETRGNVPRTYKNTLLFMATDKKNLDNLIETVRDYKAWSEILDETKLLNLDALKIMDAEENLKKSEENFKMKLSQAYSRIFAPKSGTNLNNFDWQVEKIVCTNDDNIEVAAQKILKCEMCLKELGNIYLKSLLDEYIWQKNDCVSLNKLWEYFATYYYLPRLNDKKVLIECVTKGIEAKSFALADDEDFTNLKFGEKIFLSASEEKFLVKAEVAEKLLAKDESVAEEVAETEAAETETSTETTPPKSEPLPQNFFMNKNLDSMRLTKDFNNCVDEIWFLFKNLPDAKISVHIEMNISAPAGISKEIQETVEWNCNNLEIKNWGFN